MTLTKFKRSTAWICSCRRKNGPEHDVCEFCRQPKPGKAVNETAGRIVRTSLASLEKKLDKVFNEWIRKRDTLKGGVFKCISCSDIKPTSQMHAGHFHSAGHNKSIRWDERNVNGQCVRCNYHLHGNPLAYKAGMIAKYGKKVVDELEVKRFNKSKMTSFEVQLLIDEYTKKLKA